LTDASAPGDARPQSAGQGVRTELHREDRWTEAVRRIAFKATRSSVDADPMRTLEERIGSILPLEPGERIACAAYVRAIGSRGPSLVALSDRRLLVAPRSAWMSVGVWSERRLSDVRIEATTRRSWGVVPAGRRFEVIEDGEPPMGFDLGSKDARAFSKAFERRLVARR
jgi:hypothetical protein